MVAAWPSSVAVVVDSGRVAGRIHQIVEIGEADAGHIIKVMVT
jgi:hypothetical protein